MRYFTFEEVLSLYSTVLFYTYGIPKFRLASFQMLNSHAENGYCIGQHKFRRFLWKANEHSIPCVFPCLTEFCYSLDTY